jgi:hypothetical protein
VAALGDPKKAADAYMAGDAKADEMLAALGPHALYHIAGAMLAKGQKPTLAMADTMGISLPSIEFIGTLLNASKKGTLVGGKTFADAANEPGSVQTLLQAHFQTPEKVVALANPFLKAHGLPMLGAPGSTAPSAQPMAGDPKVSPGADVLQHPAVVSAFSAATNAADLHKTLKGLKPEAAEAGWEHKAVAQWLVQKGVTPEQAGLLALAGDYPDATPTTATDLMLTLSTLPSKTKAALKKHSGEDWMQKYMAAFKAAEHFTHPEAALPFGVTAKMLPKQLITAWGSPQSWYETLKEMESGKPSVGSAVVKFSMAGGDPKELADQWKSSLGPKWKEKLVQAAAKLHGYSQDALPDEVQTQLPPELAQLHSALQDSDAQAVLGDVTGPYADMDAGGLKTFKTMLSAIDEGTSATFKGLAAKMKAALGPDWKNKALQGVAQFHGLPVDPDDLDPPQPTIQPDAVQPHLDKLMNVLDAKGWSTVEDLENEPEAAPLKALYGDAWVHHVKVALNANYSTDIPPETVSALVGPPATGNPAVMGLLFHLQGLAVDAHSAATAAEDHGALSPDVAAYMKSLYGSQWPAKLGVMYAQLHHHPVDAATLVKASTPYEAGTVPTWTPPVKAPSTMGVGAGPSVETVKGAVPEKDYDDFQAMLVSSSDPSGWDSAFLHDVMNGKGEMSSDADYYTKVFKKALEPLYGADWPHHLAAAMHLETGVPLPPQSALKVLPPVDAADLQHPDVTAMLEKANTYTTRMGLLYHLDAALKDQLEEKYGAGWREKMAMHITAQAGGPIPPLVLSHVLDLEKTKPGTVTFGAGAPTPAAPAAKPAAPTSVKAPPFDANQIVMEHLPGPFIEGLANMSEGELKTAAADLAAGKGSLGSFAAELKHSMEPTYGKDWPAYALAAAAVSNDIHVPADAASKLIASVDPADLAHPDQPGIVNHDTWAGGMTPYGGLVQAYQKLPAPEAQALAAKYGPHWANLLAAHTYMGEHDAVPPGLLQKVMKETPATPAGGAPAGASGKAEFSADAVKGAVPKPVYDAFTDSMASITKNEGLAAFYDSLEDGSNPHAAALKAKLEPVYGADWAAHAMARARERGSRLGRPRKVRAASTTEGPPPLPPSEPQGEPSA